MGSSSSSEEEEAPRPSYFQQIQTGYNELVGAIIRPPRCQYDTAMLGPSKFEFIGKSFERHDFELKNERGLKIVCSKWTPTSQYRQSSSLPCVIYMHGNSSARLEGLNLLSLVLSLGATFVTFDFSGSGKSEGEYVSLGAFEKDDLKCVIEYLRNEGTTSTIALWGRSMGAATALLHGERDPSIAGMILDSAFASLEMLAEEMVEKGRKHGLFAPGFVVAIAMRFIRSSVLKKAEFDIKELAPIDHADKCYIPALFIAAEGDDFVSPHHTQKIYHQYAGDKNVIIVDGDHNSQRPAFMYDMVAIFLVQTLQIPESWVHPGGGKQFARLLPWTSRKKKTSGFNSLSLEDNLALVQGELDNDNGSNIDIGMTAERQQAIRNKLYTMLGDTQGQVNNRQNPTARENSDKQQWTCKICTLINVGSDNICQACGTFNDS
jgi:pimeloyl-ACP methyl ester carboxylesterase